MSTVDAEGKGEVRVLALPFITFGLRSEAALKRGAPAPPVPFREELIVSKSSKDPQITESREEKRTE